MSDSPFTEAQVDCPHCGGAVSFASDPSVESIVCPHCGQPFSPRDDAAEDADRSREDELDELRIRQQSTLRRALYRSRSHAVIAAVACVVAAAEATRVGYHSLQNAAIGYAVICAIVLIVGLIGAAYAYRRAMALHREAQRSAIAQPTHDPDFSTLGDGSDRWEKLHDVR